MHMKNIVVFASHNGSDLQAVIDGCREGKIAGRVAAVISNNNDAYALKRAGIAGIDGFCLNSALYPDETLFDRKTLEVLEKYDADIIFLAGYLKKIGPLVLQKYENRIFNIHPALLPKYGGRGMYGMNVHKAVIEAGEEFTGVTIHKVTADYDAGGIVKQAKIPVLKDDTPGTLAARVLELEHRFIVEVLSEICLNENYL